MEFTALLIVLALLAVLSMRRRTSRWPAALAVLALAIFAVVYLHRRCPACQKRWVELRRQLGLRLIE